MKPFKLSFSFPLKVPLDLAWELFSHTDKLNQSMGLPPVKYTQNNQLQEVPTLKAEAKSMGITLKWDEIPFEWIRHQTLLGVRSFENGPMKQVLMQFDLASEKEASLLHLKVVVQPKNFLVGWLLKPVLKKKIQKDFGKVVAHLNDYGEKKAETPLAKPKKINFNEAVYSQRVSDVLKQYSQYELLSQKLRAYLKESYDNEVLAVRPFELADLWQENRKEVLSFLLSAVRAGVVDLRWAVMCPSCKIPTNQQTTLKQLQQETHCQGCQIKYNTEFDRSVEVRFSVNEAIRKAKSELYCIGNPGSKSEIFAQFLLQPNEQRHVVLPLPQTRWKAVLFSQDQQSFSLQQEEVDRVLEIKIGEEKIVLSKEKVGPPVVLTLTNTTNKKRLIQFEDDRWRDQAATAAYVTSLSRFRDLFSSEILAPGEEIAVRNLSVMFTDLKGSTAFYQQTGDAKAYHLVRSHFNFINAILEKYNGVLVKTIGDAVFAVFFTSVEAVQAAIEIQQQIGQFNQTHESQFEIKLGVHTGPLIAVNANGRIDYFGSTTNIGSRLEKESQGGDVILTQEVLQDPDTQEFLTTQSHKQEPLTTQLRGITQTFNLTRLIP